MGGCGFERVIMGGSQAKGVYDPRWDSRGVLSMDIVSHVRTDKAIRDRTKALNFKAPPSFGFA